MTSALILFAHGARDPAWSSPLERVRDTVRRLRPDVTVKLAFLEFMAPTLGDCVAALAASGVRKIVVVPMFIAQGGHLKKELPAMVEILRSTCPGTEISIEPAIGENAAVVQAMAEAVVRTAEMDSAEQSRA
jgi:sirohydrochlorin cobaltochelatase